MSSFTPRDNSLVAKSLALSRLRATTCKRFSGRMRARAQHSNNAWLPAPTIANVSDSGRASAFAATAVAAVRQALVPKPDDRADPPVVLVDQEDRRAMARSAFARVVGPKRANLKAGQLKRRTRLERESVLRIRRLCDHGRKHFRVGGSRRNERLPHGPESRFMRDEAGRVAFRDKYHR